MSIVERGLSSLFFGGSLSIPFHFLFLLLLRSLLSCFYCLLCGGFCCPFCGYFCYPHYMCFGSLVDIFILKFLQMRKSFRSILKGGTILSSSYNIVCVGLKCEKCSDIDSLQVKSRATNRWLVQNMECICFLLNLNLIYLFRFVSTVRPDYK